MSKHDTLDSKIQKDLKILLALMTLGGKSDREMAKILGMNNTTFSKRKRKLEQEGYIKEYTIIPDFHKMGLDYIAFSFASTTDLVATAQIEEAKEMLQKCPQVLWFVEDQSLTGTFWLTVSVHKTYDDYLELSKSKLEECNLLHPLPKLEQHNFIFHTDRKAHKAFSLRYLDSLIFPPTIPLQPVRKRKHYATMAPNAS